jgi:hypothetical protein
MTDIYVPMFKQIESSHNMQDIIELILAKVNQDNLTVFNDLRFFLDKPKMMTFLINNHQGIPEITKYYDPLYANPYIRNVNPQYDISLTIKLESNDDFSRIDRDVVLKKPGYAKFKYYDGSFDWREVKIKDPEQKITKRDSTVGVKFKCLSYPCIDFLVNF